MQTLVYDLFRHLLFDSTARQSISTFESNSQNIKSLSDLSIIGPFIHISTEYNFLYPQQI